MLLTIFIFILGSLIGSFLNVCIYRLPRGESVVYPPSHCIHCNNKIRWFDNIPFLSFLFLRGRCRFCARPISFRYFIVEFLTASLAVAFYMAFGITAKFFLFFLLGAALIVSTFIDFEHQLIPDIITIPGIFMGLSACFLFPYILGAATPLAGIVNSLAGVVAGSGSIAALNLFGSKLFSRKLKSLGLEEAMGGGDVMLMAMIGAFVGWKLVLLVFFLAPFFGSAAGIITKIRDKKDIIPYGPYISLAAIVVIFWGDRVLNYLSLY